MFVKPIQPLIQEINNDLLSEKNVRLLVQREDLIHPFVSGNKWRKLKYNLVEAKKTFHSKVLTFGGAFSNHILATACATAELNMESIGVIRGERHLPLNPTLTKAKSFGMEFHYINREIYSKKDETDWKKLYPEHYILPEGGTNALAVKGCEEIIYNHDFDVVCCSCGTGGTIAGIINKLQPHQKAMAFSALKGAGFLTKNIQEYVQSSNWELCLDYHFGGYAKVDKSLIDFINKFNKSHNIPLDPIYTGKLFFGVLDLVSKDYFRDGSIILLIHTGGLQAIAGMNERIKNKGWCIEYL